MPTVLTHAAVPLAMSFALGRAAVPRRLLLAGIAAAMAPDLDVLAFRLGIPYADVLGHRGATHSLACAALVAGLAACGAARLGTTRAFAAAFVFVAMASHGLLDMLTNGGLGVAIAWPVSDARWFFPARIIEVSPLGLHRLLGGRGGPVLATELAWVWAPAMAIGLAGFAWRRWRARRAAPQ